MTADLNNLAVEVLRLDNKGWSVGSGFFVRPGLVLTACHCVHDQDKLLVRIHGKEKYPAVVRLQGDKDEVDLAVLEVSDVSLVVPSLRYGKVDPSVRGTVKECWAIGFPWFKSRNDKRFSAQVDGEIPTGDNLNQLYLTLQVKNKDPRPGLSDQSEWAGISGAVVLADDDVIVGVIGQHHLPEGERSLTIVPITAIDLLSEDEATKWWKLLGVDRQALVSLPGDERGQQPGSLRSRRCDFYEYISPPVHYVNRPEVLEAVRSALLDGGVPSPSDIPLALHGMGGIGKSIIARVLCDDPVVQRAFPDGILWVTLGKKPELVQEMRNWVQALGGTISENVPTPESLKNLLVKLFRDRTCLLIIDDVWQHSAAEAFCVGGPHCRMLLTTRDAEIARELGAKVQSIPDMTETEAITLLESWSGSDGRLTGADSKLKGQIVKRLGYLPLAVKLAGAQLRRKQASEWLQTFTPRNLKSSRPEGIHDDLERTFNLSLVELDKDPRPLRRFYVSLAIFKEDEAIPQAAIERLWSSYDSFDAQSTTDILDDLAARALLDVSSSGSSMVVRLHDLLHDLLDMELNDGRIAAHQALLKAYYAMRKGGGWHAVDDDGYLYDHLAYHLHASRAIDELKGLFANQHWLQKRVPQRDYTYDGYLSDLALVWKYAEAETRQQIKMNQEPAGYADCMRYLLIQTSINGLAGNYSPELVTRAVEAGLWSSHRALSIAAKIPDEAQRGKMCAALLKTTRLSKEQREEAQRLGLEAILTLLRKIDFTEILAKFLPELAPQLPEEGLKEALGVALAITNERERAKALAVLAPLLPEERQEQVLEAALTISEERGGRTRVLAALAPQMTGEMQEKVLKAALALSNEPEQVEVLAALAPHLPTEKRTRVLDAAFKSAFASSDEWKRARMLTLLAPHLSAEMQEPALEAALSISEEGKRAEVLAVLAPYLPEKGQEQVLRAALALTDEQERAEVLTALVPHLSGERRTQVLAWAVEAALALSDEWKRASALAALAPHLSAERQKRVLEAALALTEESPRTEALTALAQVAGERQEQVLEAVLDITDERERAEVLAELAPHLPVEMQKRVLGAALSMSNKWGRASVLTLLAPHLPAEMQAPALEATLTLTDEDTRVQALTELAPRLSGQRRTRVLAWILEATMSLPDGQEQAEALEALTPQVTGEMQEQVLAAALNLAEEWRRAKVLEALAPQVTGEMQEQVLEAALDIADEWKRAEVLEALASQVTGERQERVLEAALELAYEWTRAKVLAALVPHLPEEWRPQVLEWALEAALAVRDERVLATLAPYLPEERRTQALEEVLEAALSITSERDRAQVLATLAPHLPEERRTQVLEWALEAALAISNEDALALWMVVDVLAPQVTGEMLEQILQAALVISHEWGRAQTLAALAPWLTERQLERVLAAALALSHERDRTDVMIAILPFVPDQVQLLQSIQQIMLDDLLSMQYWSREASLRHMFSDGHFRPSVFSSETLGAIALHFIEIGEEWHWI